MSPSPTQRSAMNLSTTSALLGISLLGLLSKRCQNEFDNLAHWNCVLSLWLTLPESDTASSIDAKKQHLWQLASEKASALGASVRIRCNAAIHTAEHGQFRTQFNRAKRMPPKKEPLMRRWKRLPQSDIQNLSCLHSSRRSSGTTSCGVHSQEIKSLERFH